jgi:transcriptional regulator with XRE-family HTH domain
VRYGEREYERDLVRCRRELLQREMEGMFGSVPELARKAGLSRSTVSAFFRGDRPGTRATVARILRELGLSFDDVHREIARERRA